MRNDWIFDLETFPNVFTAAFEHADSPLTLVFEISPWRDDSSALMHFLDRLREDKARLVGFNNLGFDYPILHQFIKMNGKCGAAVLYDKAQAIIEAQDTDRWTHQVYPSDRYIEQIDLYKIQHFDNKARSTGLKALEFNMRAETIEDLPFPVGSTLTRDQVSVLKRYNQHDVAMTKRFYHHSTAMIEFRQELTAKYNRDFMNHNDTKIGKDYFVMKLEEAGVTCYDFSSTGRKPRQTPRPVIHLKDAILPWITFDEPEFNRVLTWLKQQSITETKGVFNDLVARVGKFDFVFGLGGIHGSVENRVIEATEDHAVIDLDVTSYYPNLAIRNGFYPAHLGADFPKIYDNLFQQRKSFKKGSAENAMLKLALNGVYGDSNNKFSVFYDPLFTMSITLTGQLLLCKLAESILHATDAELIQMNTDGLTVRIPMSQIDALERVRESWQTLTGLNLEEFRYRKMFIRDVNNYLGQYEDGGVKRKGAYEYDIEWHQNASALVIPKVAEKVLLEDAPIRSTVENWPDRMDFMLRVKVPRTSYLQWGEARVQNTSRYYIAKGGKPLKKWMPPLKGKTEWRQISVESGWGVQVCNRIEDAVLPVDFDYYIKEVGKLCLSLA